MRGSRACARDVRVEGAGDIGAQPWVAGEADLRAAWPAPVTGAAYLAGALFARQRPAWPDQPPSMQAHALCWPAQNRHTCLGVMLDDVNECVPLLCSVEFRLPQRAKKRAPPMLFLGILIGVWIGVPLGMVIIAMLGPREVEAPDTSGLHAILAQLNGTAPDLAGAPAAPEIPEPGRRLA